MFECYTEERIIIMDIIKQLKSRYYMYALFNLDVKNILLLSERSTNCIVSAWLFSHISHIVVGNFVPSFLALFYLIEKIFL